MKKIAIVVLVVAAVAGYLFFNKLNPMVKEAVETVGGKVLQVPVTLDGCNLSIFSGEGSLKGLTIGNPKGYTAPHAFALGRIAVALDVKSVTSDTIHIRSIEIQSPEIVYEGNNLKQLAANASSFAGSGGGDSAAAKDEGGAGKKLIIDRLLLDGATVKVVLPRALAGKVLAGQDLSVTIPSIELHDIGKDRKATAAEVLKLILAKVNASVIPAAQKGLAGLGADVQARARELENQARAAARDAESQARAAAKGIESQAKGNAKDIESQAKGAIDSVKGLLGQ